MHLLVEVLLLVEDKRMIESAYTKNFIILSVSSCAHVLVYVFGFLNRILYNLALKKVISIEKTWKIHDWIAQTVPQVVSKDRGIGRGESKYQYLQII